MFYEFNFNQQTAEQLSSMTKSGALLLYEERVLLCSLSLQINTGVKAGHATMLAFTGTYKKANSH